MRDVNGCCTETERPKYCDVLYVVSHYCLFMPCSYTAASSCVHDDHLHIVITGSAVALHCCKAHSNINRKMENSTLCTMVTPENFTLKLGTRDYVEEVTYYTIFVSIHCVARGLVQAFCTGVPHRAVVPCDSMAFLHLTDIARRVAVCRSKASHFNACADM